MAKKQASPAKSIEKAPAKSPVKAASSPAVSSTPVRKTPVPAVAKAAAPAAKREVTYDAIAYRAFELYQHGRPGSDMDHWLAAETELRGR